MNKRVQPKLVRMFSHKIAFAHDMACYRLFCDAEAMAEEGMTCGRIEGLINKFHMYRDSFSKALLAQKVASPFCALYSFDFPCIVRSADDEVVVAPKGRLRRKILEKLR